MVVVLVTPGFWATKRLMDSIILLIGTLGLENPPILRRRSVVDLTYGFTFVIDLASSKLSAMHLQLV